MVAGFALAALIADDRELDRVRGAVPDETLSALHARLALTGTREEGVRALLAHMRPKLDPRAASLLPVRMRTLLGRVFSRAERGRLSPERLPSRGDFQVDEELLTALLRVARRATEESP